MTISSRVVSVISGRRRRATGFKRLLAGVAALALSTGFAGRAQAQVSLWQINNVSGFQTPTPDGISADGSRVAGYVATGSITSRRWEWTPATNLVLAPSEPGPFTNYTFGLSDDGNTRVGRYDDATGRNIAYRQVGSGPAENLGNLGYHIVDARAVSADGSVVIGSSSSNQFVPTQSIRAFRWTAATGMVAIPALPNQGVSMGWDVSSDGNAVVGGVFFGNEQSFRWTPGGGTQRLPTLTESNVAGRSSTARGVSGDGSVVVGFTTSPLTSKVEAYRWTESGGTVGLGLLASMGDQSESLALDVSADGRAIIGQASNSNGSARVATLWNQNLGLVDLKQAVLTAFGAANLPANFSQWTFDKAEAISADGTTITGRGFSPVTGGDAAWVLRYAGGFQNLGGSVSAAAPEPGAFALLALALPLGVAAYRRRK